MGELNWPSILTSSLRASCKFLILDVPFLRDQPSKLHEQDMRDCAKLSEYEKKTKTNVN